jgi:hypothetical protein
MVDRRGGFGVLNLEATMAFVVPDEYMIPLGAEATKRLQKCADYWNPRELNELREQLPREFHDVDLEDLRRRWINIRKNRTPGYKVSGHGPENGSMKRPKIPERAQEFLLQHLCPTCRTILEKYLTARRE